jgi:hypothetical protein
MTAQPDRRPWSSPTSVAASRFDVFERAAGTTQHPASPIATALTGPFHQNQASNPRHGDDPFSLSLSKWKSVSICVHLRFQPLFGIHFSLPKDSNRPTEHRTLLRPTGEVHRQPVSRQPFRNNSTCVATKEVRMGKELANVEAQRLNFGCLSRLPGVGRSF